MIFKNLALNRQNIIGHVYAFKNPLCFILVHCRNIIHLSIASNGLPGSLLHEWCIVTWNYEMWVSHGISYHSVVLCLKPCKLRCKCDMYSVCFLKDMASTMPCRIISRNLDQQICELVSVISTVSNRKMFSLNFCNMINTVK